MSRHRRPTLALSLIALVLTLLLAGGAFHVARGADPIKIGFGMATFFGPSWSLAVSFGILLLALAVRPAGLFGR